MNMRSTAVYILKNFWDHNPALKTFHSVFLKYWKFNLNNQYKNKNLFNFISNRFKGKIKLVSEGAERNFDKLLDNAAFNYDLDLLMQPNTNYINILFDSRHNKRTSSLRCQFLHMSSKSRFVEKFFSKEITSKKEKAIPKEESEENWGGPEAFKLIIFMRDDFDAVLNNNPSILVFFSASWCPHCMRLRKPYGKAALMAKEANLPIVFGTFDVSINPEIADEKGVVGIPTLKYYKNGKFVSNFKGKRTAEEIFQFAKNPLTYLTEGKKADV